MSTQVASLFGILSLDDKDFIRGIGIAKSGVLRLENDLDKMGGGLTDAVRRTSDKITEIGGELTLLGGAIQTIIGPLMGFGGAALDAAVDFDESMKNVQAAAGYTSDEMIGLSAQVLEIGEASRYGPAQAAEAFYEIAGGVSDASVRMAVFEESVKAAQAGNANLTSTTSAMISIMNAYGFSAGEAGLASDVLTRMVGTGVGSMDQFAAAIPKATAMAANLGVPLADVGSQMAFLTTKGFTASESATKLAGMMTSLINPSADVAAAIKEAGYASGRAMVEAEGLTGAYQTLAENNGGNLDGLIKDQEALSGATQLATDEFIKFDEAFKGMNVQASDGPKALIDNMDLVSTSIQGATADAEAIQMTSTAAQFDLLTASVDTLKIAVGDQLAPVLADLTTNTLIPLVGGVMDWVKANPQLVMGIIGLVMGGAILATVLTVAGTAITAIGVALGVLMSPIGLAILAVALLGLAYMTNFGGIKDFIDGTVRPILDDFFKMLGDVWAVVQPALQSLYDWFVLTGMPAITTAVEDVWHNGIEPFVNFLAAVWTTILQPAIQPLVDWFISGAWQNISGAVETVKGIIETAFTALSLIWTTILQPGLQPIVDWFTSGAGFQTITTVVDGVMAAAEIVFNFFRDAWEGTIKPGIQPLVDWFNSPAGMGAVSTAVDGIGTRFNELVTTISGIWAALQGPINALKDGIIGALQPIADMINAIIGGFASLAGLGGQAAGVAGQADAAGVGDGELWNMTLDAAGGNDVLARIAFSQIQNAPKAAGGPVTGGMPYMVGEQGREVFVPESSGTIVPNGPTEGMMGGMTISIGAIYANDAAGGRDAAQSFDGRLRELQAARGTR